MKYLNTMASAAVMATGVLMGSTARAEAPIDAAGQAAVLRWAERTQAKAALSAMAERVQACALRDGVRRDGVSGRQFAVLEGGTARIFAPVGVKGPTVQLDTRDEASGQPVKITLDGSDGNGMPTYQMRQAYGEVTVLETLPNSYESAAARRYALRLQLADIACGGRRNKPVEEGQPTDYTAFRG